MISSSLFPGGWYCRIGLDVDKPVVDRGGFVRMDDAGTMCVRKFNGQTQYNGTGMSRYAHTFINTLKIDTLFFLPVLTISIIIIGIILMSMSIVSAMLIILLLVVSGIL